MNKKLVKKQNHISMEKFLRDYCHLESELLIERLSRLSHREVKEVCKKAYQINLLTLPFEAVGVDDVKCGNVVFVSDAYYNSAPYENPNKINVREIISQNPPFQPLSYEMDYAETVDFIENSLVSPKIKSIGSFKTKGRK